MKLNRHSGLALLLILFGAFILLNKIGIHTGHLMGYLFPVALIGLGWLGIKNGKSFFGMIFMAIGGMILLFKLSWLIAIAFAIWLIYYGFSLLKNKSNVY
jgi:lia operon protein LiaI